MELPNIVYARVDRDEDGEFVVSSDCKIDMLDFDYGIYQLISIVRDKITKEI
jgi:hypothetical protein